MASTSADPQLSQIEVRAFDSAVPVNQFCCGRPVLDRWLKNKAKKSAQRYEHRVFLACVPGRACPIGYYDLQVGSESVDALTEKPTNYLQNYTAFPAVHLSYLAVHEDYQGYGIGKFLLGDIFERVTGIADHAGFYALTLQSLDEHSTAFYKKLGFVAYSTNPTSPKMLIPIMTILELVRGKPTS
jgi:GNAT superfamily N-acetyltransferase